MYAIEKLRGLRKKETGCDELIDGKRRRENKEKIPKTQKTISD